MNDSGLLIVVSGPSGAGKGTICAALRKQFPNIQYSISMTTRQPRPGEVDGVNYYFSDNARFEQLLSEDAFLEHAKVYDHYYGTPKKYVYQMLDEGQHVMLEIDIQGAMQVRNAIPRASLFTSCRPAVLSWNTDCAAARPIARRLLTAACPKLAKSSTGSTAMTMSSSMTIWKPPSMKRHRS